MNRKTAINTAHVIDANYIAPLPTRDHSGSVWGAGLLVGEPEGGPRVAFKIGAAAGFPVSLPTAIRHPASTNAGSAPPTAPTACPAGNVRNATAATAAKIGRASCRERG